MKLEVLEQNHYYHIYNKGINGCTIFDSDENKMYFLKQYAKYLSTIVSTFAYCLMDNHFHFVIQLKNEEKEVTQGFSNLLNSYAKSFNKQNNRSGSLFEKHFKRIKLVDENYLKQVILYVHLNPKHHLNLHHTKYKFSSYQAVLSDKKTSLEREAVIDLFDTIENFVFCHSQKSELLTQKETLE